ncbi:MAG: STAS domain-containing protein [Actinobacteria bacterium]|nr:STAS domain-containing protein [Actinomycetota bacterium]
MVTLPAEIDMANACRVGEDLRAAFAPGVRIVIADMSGTRFCDTSGIHVLVQAHKQAIASGAEFRVVASARVLQVLAVLSLDTWLAIYPSLDKAVAGAPTPEEDASHE